MNKITLTEEDWYSIANLAKLELKQLEPSLHTKDKKAITKLERFLWNCEASHLTLIEDEPF